MARILAAAASLALLAACDGQQPLNFAGVVDNEPVVVLDDNGDPIEFLANGIPQSVGGTLTAVNYNSITGDLEVQIESLDSTPTFAEYERNAALDVPGYIAYSQQEDSLDRMFIAYVQQSNDGATQGVFVMDGGQFTKFFAGVNYSQEGAYSPHSPSQPNNGLVSYAGNYVGMLNIDADRPNQAIPVAAGVSASLIPNQAARVTGDVLINADFADMTVNGGVANRQIIDTSGLIFVGDGSGAIPNGVLLPVFMIPTDIDATGTFMGEMHSGSSVKIGDYAGTFGGSNASGIALGIHLDGDFIPQIEQEEEYGFIVLNQCGTPGEGALCSGANP